MHFRTYTPPPRARRAATERIYSALVAFLLGLTLALLLIHWASCEGVC